MGNPDWKRQREKENYRSNKKMSYSAQAKRNSIKPGVVINLWARIDVVKKCYCINLKSGFVYLISLPVSQQKENTKDNKHYGSSKEGRLNIGVIKVNLGTKGLNFSNKKNQTGIMKINVGRKKNGADAGSNASYNYVEYNVNKKTLKLNRIVVNKNAANETLNVSKKISINAGNDSNLTKKTSKRSIKNEKNWKEKWINDKKSVLERASYEKINRNASRNRRKFTYYNKKIKNLNENTRQKKMNKKLVKNKKVMRGVINNQKVSFARQHRRVFESNRKKGKRRRRKKKKAKLNLLLGLNGLVLSWKSKETKSIFNKLSCF